LFKEAVQAIPAWKNYDSDLSYLIEKQIQRTGE
jgi:hypothetical protein